MNICRRITCSIFLSLCSIVLVASTASADVCQDIQAKLARGERAQKQDQDAILAELSKDQNNPTKRFVAGEVLANLGLYALAKDQFQAADGLQKDYVLNKFHSEFETNKSVPADLQIYIQEKYPNDPALLLYLARRHLNEIPHEQKERDEHVKTARKELMMAKEPWSGSLALLGMIEYDDALTKQLGQERNEKLALAIKYAQLELAKHPDEPLALKVSILAQYKQGSNPEKLVGEILHALEIMPHDPELNVMLGRIYLDKKDYAAAAQPVLTGLIRQHDHYTKREAFTESNELVKHLSRKELFAAIDKAANDPGNTLLQKTLLRMRISDLCVMQGKQDDSIAQLEVAYQLNPAFRPHLSLKIARELVFAHRYADADPYLAAACQLTVNPVNAKRILAFRQRVWLINYNSRRDIALQLKTLFATKHKSN